MFNPLLSLSHLASIEVEEVVYINAKSGLKEIRVTKADNTVHRFCY
jgi:hypothetical protein